MEIKYLGHSSFLIKTKDAKCITDPYDPSFVGLKYPKQEADIVTVSHSHKDHSYTEQITGEPLILTWPGQFEKKGVRVWGYKTFHDTKEGVERGENIVYKIEAEGVNVLHCGDLGHGLTDAFLDEVGDVDVLLVPVGNKYTLGSNEAWDLVKKVEPAIVIPMHYNREGLSIEGLSPLDEFLKKTGTEVGEQQDKLVLKKEDFALEQALRVVVLNS